MDIHVEKAEVRQQANGESFVELTLAVTDGARNYKHGIGFPSETLEWRVAEFDLNSEDIEGLLDLVIAEAFVPPAAPDEPSLYNAPTIALAREAHLGRLAQRGLRLTHDSATMDIVRTACEIDSETVELKRKLVEKTRERRLNPAPASNRRERLAKHLNRMEEGGKPMTTIATDKIGPHRQTVTQNARVCGQCGALIAAEHVSRHSAWHAQASWTQVTVTADNGVV